jgi:DNA-binding GntR family transcriptional regulator
MPIPDTQRVRLQPTLLRDAARDAIRDRIQDGTFRPGERLDDRELQAWLGISRTPIREALSALAREGFVEIGGHSSTRVVNPDVNEVTDRMRALGLLLAGSVRLAMSTWTDDTHTEIQQAIDSAYRAAVAHDESAHVRAVDEVFELFARGSGSEHFADLFRDKAPALGYCIRVSLAAKGLNWGLLARQYARMRNASHARDLAGLTNAIEVIFRIRPEVDPARS